MDDTNGADDLLYAFPTGPTPQNSKVNLLRWFDDFVKEMLATTSKSSSVNKGRRNDTRPRMLGRAGLSRGIVSDCKAELQLTKEKQQLYEVRLPAFCV